MKSPHNQRPDEQARADTEKFIATYARGRAEARRHTTAANAQAAKPRQGRPRGSAG